MSDVKQSANVCVRFIFNPLVFAGFVNWPVSDKARRSLSLSLSLKSAKTVSEFTEGLNLHIFN